ncbi:protein da1-related 5 [Quercus suber]|uniref:Protein da1-related 5 n=1 Tax=Quercus suber TaxID=58331 RepID=A0AAW0I6X9_QUESU
MADLVTGGAVGAAFGEGFAILHGTVKDVVENIIMFKSILKRLESTLDGIAPQAKKIKEESLALGRPEKETKSLIEKMKKGEKLVLKCSKIKTKRCWSLNDCVKAYSYSKQLKELNDSIEKFCQNTSIVLETSAKLDQNTSIALETTAKVDRVLERFDNSDVKRKFGARTLSCAVPRPQAQDNIFGLGLPLEELKMELKKKEEQVLLLTALGGCGKTTLVQMLCWDDEIKDTLNLFASKNKNK